MATAGGIAAGLLGSAASEAAAFAAGLAIGPALAPEVEFLRNEAWSAVQTKALDAATAAEVAAENFASYGDMEKQAAFNGIAAPLFKYLYDVTLSAPGTGELLAMLRRGTISNGNFTHGLRKAKLEPMWDDPLHELQTVRLSPQELALGIVRSTVADPGLLITTLDTQGSTIPKYPHWPGDALNEAEAGGIDKDRLRVMVGAVGLPMSPQQAASAAFRQIINRQAFNLSILEGDIRPEYADAIFEQARQILTAGEYAELQLRGYYDRATRLQNTRKHGMTDADSDLLYNVQGRGLSLHAAFVAERRGGVFNGPTDQIPEWAMFQLQRGNLRPEVYNLAWAGRETLPSAFVIRALLTGGAIDTATGEDLFLRSGWPANLAKQVADFYGKNAATTSTADPHVTKADNQLWTAQHSAYVKDRSDDAFATATLQELGVASGAIPTVLARWQRERAIIRSGLSAAQIKKAYGNAAVNAATGATWTRDEAVAALVELGYSSTEASSYLNI